MHKTILITGGAGFIGQHLSRKLVTEGYLVKVLDSFSSQVHGDSKDLPDDLKSHVELIRADIRDRDAVRLALKNVDSIVHLAAETGTGQSMYEIERYYSVNVQGTAVLLDVLQNDITLSGKVESITVASSRAVYGEGAYLCRDHGLIYPDQRNDEKLINGYFDPYCPTCGNVLLPTVTSESAPFKPMSVYGLTKQVQEQAVLMYARTQGINAFGLRYQNVYGPGQSLQNPYTGILAVFSNLARKNKTIEIYEDGVESRDFVYIDDVIDATYRSIAYSEKFIGAMNVGSGISTSVMTVAEEVKKFFDSKSSLLVTGAYRSGDIRHNFADIKMGSSLFGYEPRISFAKGLQQFLTWASGQSVSNNELYKKSVDELISKGLMRGG